MGERERGVSKDGRREERERKTDRYRCCVTASGKERSGLVSLVCLLLVVGSSGSLTIVIYSVLIS